MKPGPGGRADPWKNREDTNRYDRVSDLKITGGHGFAEQAGGEANE